MTTASWTLDDLALLTTDVEDRALDDAQGYHLELLGDDLEMTSAEQAMASIQSQLFDGEAITTGSYSNMSATLPVALVGVDSGALGRAAAELIRVLRRPGMRQLTYRAADGASPATVFDALHVKPDPQPNDLAEADNRRVYMLTLTCKPFPRSDTEISVEATAVGAPTFTLIDAVNSAAAWSAQDPDWPAPSGSAMSEAQSWTPLRYAIATNPLTSSTYKTQGWAKGSGATAMGWSDGAMLITGKPTSSTTRIYVNSPKWLMVGTGQIRLRIEMGSAFVCNFGLLYRWFNSAGKQIGSDLTITEVPRTQPTHILNALVTPPSGAVMLSIHPYTRYGNATGGVRTSTAEMVYAGPDGTSFNGDTPDTATRVYDWIGTPYASQQVELGLASMAAGTGQVSVTGYYHAASQLSPVLTRTASWATTDAAPYLVVTGQITGAPAAIQISGATGQGWINASLNAAAADGSFKAYFNVGSRSGSSLSIRVKPLGTSPGAMATLMVTQLDAATSLPPIGTGRQGKFTLDIEGTMPAEASLKVANGGGVGSNVLIYTAPANPNFMPALSPSMPAAGTTSATSISNKTFTVPTSSPSANTWEVPHSGLVSSTYAVFAKLSGSGLTAGAAYTFNLYQQTAPEVGAGPYGDNRMNTAKVIAPGTGFNGFAQIGTLRLPLVDTDQGAAAIECLKLWVSGGTWTLDEAWLFDMVSGQLSHVTPPSTTYGNVVIRAASPDHPQQRYRYEGSAVRGFESYVKIWGNHRFDPATDADVFVVCDAATPALSVSASYFPRWDMFAAELGDDGTT